MREKGLLRAALEGGKTVSKKARSKQSSVSSSRAGSRATSAVSSRATSAQGSDEDDGNDSDGADMSSAWSVNSMEGVPEADEEHFIWTDELTQRIESILDRKRSSATGREEDLRFYVHILRHHYARNIVSKQAMSLATALLKSIKLASTPTEPVTALKALALTIITDPTDDLYTLCSNPLHSLITNSPFELVKAEAIHTLGTLHSTSPSTDVDDTLTFLLDIIATDGTSVSAPDSAPVVAAAIEVYALLATLSDDLSDATEETIAALSDQLESTDPQVQISAGETIALLYEKSYTELESDEEPDTSDDESPDPGDDDNAPATTMRQRYTPFRRRDLLLHTLDALASVSSKRLSKKDRKALHVAFADVAQSVRRPTLGPRYSAAIDEETDQHYGSRMTVKVGREARVRVDRWWKLVRVKGLKRLLQGGFAEHWRANGIVGDMLPAS